MVIRPKPEPTAGRRELSRRQKSTLAAMDIALWQLRAGTPPSVSKAAAARTADPLSAPAESSVPADSRVPAWEVLEAEALRHLRRVFGSPALQRCKRGARVDLNLVATAKDDIIEVQGTAEGRAIPRRELDVMIDLGLAGIRTLCAEQRAALERAGVDLKRVVNA